jgi:hypothetical protein
VTPVACCGISGIVVARGGAVRVNKAGVSVSELLLLILARDVETEIELGVPHVMPAYNIHYTPGAADETSA